MMALPNVFNASDAALLQKRIQKLNPDSSAKWGKMNVAQMLAHCNVTYEMVYLNIHPKPNFIMSFIMKKLVKSIVVNEVPYSESSQTAPQFIIKDLRDFELEKSRLIEYIDKTLQLGADHFDGLESHSFGKLNTEEWNNLFYKHLDHHMNQFGV